MRWEPLEFVDAGDSVLVAVRFVSKGSHTAIEQAVDRFQVIRVNDGRIVFTTGYSRRAEALEAVGPVEVAIAAHRLIGGSRPPGPEDKGGAG